MLRALDCRFVVNCTSDRGNLLEGRVVKEGQNGLATRPGGGRRSGGVGVGVGVGGGGGRGRGGEGRGFGGRGGEGRRGLHDDVEVVSRVRRATQGGRQGQRGEVEGGRGEGCRGEVKVIKGVQGLYGDTKVKKVSVGAVDKLGVKFLETSIAAAGKAGNKAWGG